MSKNTHENIIKFTWKLFRSFLVVDLTSYQTNKIPSQKSSTPGSVFQENHQSNEFKKDHNSSQMQVFLLEMPIHGQWSKGVV